MVEAIATVAAESAALPDDQTAAQLRGHTAPYGLTRPRSYAINAHGKEGE